MNAPITHVQWKKAWRLINSSYPPVDLFEDIADPQDWPLLNAAEQKTNPRLAESVGNLDLVPPMRRVGGMGASYVMAPFTHISVDRPGRFHDGDFGAYYAGNSFEVALFETLHHAQIFCAATDEKSGWIADMRELIGTVDIRLVDIRGGGFDALLAKDDYSASQEFARRVKTDGQDGIVYPSVRQEDGECIATFYPDVVEIPRQGRHLSYHWDGNHIDRIRFLTADQRVYRIVP